MREMMELMASCMYVFIDLALGLNQQTSLNFNLPHFHPLSNQLTIVFFENKTHQHQHESLHDLLRSNHLTDNVTSVCTDINWKSIETIFCHGYCILSSVAKMITCVDKLIKSRKELDYSSDMLFLLNPLIGSVASSAQWLINSYSSFFHFYIKKRNSDKNWNDVVVEFSVSKFWWHTDDMTLV